MKHEYRLNGGNCGIFPSFQKAYRAGLEHCRLLGLNSCTIQVYTVTGKTEQLRKTYKVWAASGGMVERIS